MDTINQVFSLFSINYHNQFYNAFRDQKTEAQAKKLWLESLGEFSEKTLLLAAKKAIRDSNYLPTIHQMISYCRHVEGTHFPDAHAAYVEACTAAQPKQNYHWSHPVVYFAGKQCGWFFLANNSESVAFPVFKNQYNELCEQIAQGVRLPAIEPLALLETSEAPLPKQENVKRLAALRKSAGI